MQTLVKMDVYKHRDVGSIFGGLVSLALITSIVAYAIMKTSQNLNYQIIEPLFQEETIAFNNEIRFEIKTENGAAELLSFEGSDR